MGVACASLGQTEIASWVLVAGQAEDIVGQRRRGKGGPEDRKECEIIGKLTKPSAKNHGAEKRDHVQKRLSDGA